MRDQALWCARMGSPLYGGLLERAAADVLEAGPTWRVLEPHAGPGRGAALALRLMAAVHRLVLTGAAPELARHYPSAGGDAAGDAWSAFRDTLAGNADELRRLAALPCQTNEVGRCAALVFGFLEAAHHLRVPLRLLEIGASAGLNLRWDHYRYGDGHSGWGDLRSPVDLSGLWDEPPDHLDAPVSVIARRGCDPQPLDPAREEHRLLLQSSVWADQTQRLHRLRAALDLAARVPATVDAASVEEWLPSRLAESAEGTATVVYHSVVEEYLAPAQLAAFQAAMEQAGARASSRSPLAWVRLEPQPLLRQHVLTLRLWPGGPLRTLAQCGSHGSSARRFVA